MTVTIVAMLACATVISLRGPLRRSRVRSAIDQLLFKDQAARASSRRTGRASEIAINLDEGIILQRDAYTGDTVGGSVILPTGMSITEVHIGGTKIDRGEAVIQVSPNGKTATYAIRLTEQKETEAWYVFAGATGQHTRLDDEAEVEKLWELLLPPRTDAR